MPVRPVSSVVGRGGCVEELDMAERGSRGRWWSRSTTMAPLGVAAVGAVVVGLVWITGGDGSSSGRVGGGANASIPAGSEAQGRAVRWDGARLVRGDPDRLTLYFTGGPPGRADEPCARAYEATAEPSGDRVTVTLRELPAPPLPPGHACALVGYGRTVTVALPEPLRGRPVVDGATGQERLVSDAALLLTPSWLPPGYRFVTERVEFGIDFREWAPEERQDVRLLVDQGDPGKLARPGFDPVVLARPVVRGMPATVWKTRRFDDSVCVSWAEGTIGHRVCTSGAPGRLLPIEVLVRVADGLRG
jgi:hypothetical protein